uniref:Putative GRAS domain family protein n=1 Tax=Linum usitatissimum TaxID=4006 RepID=A0A172MLD4_LINUS|nr:putative GRAS domain family protein [Linum usitatissimum]
MASGFPGGGGFSGSGGGGSDSYFAGRSMNSSSFNPNNTTQLPYRAQQQLPQIFLDQSSQIGHQRNHHHHHLLQQQQQQQSPASSCMGKRALSDFQGINPGLNSLLLRSVKPRIYQNNCSDFSGNLAINNNNFSAENSFSALSSQRYGLPLLQQLRPQPINVLPQQTLQGVPFAQTRTQNNKPVSVSVGSGGPGQDSEKKMMNRLQELEKQLLDDDEEAEGEEGQSDAVSVITNANSEWSETIQNLITPSSSPNEKNSNNVGQNQISPSPSPSSSSSTTSSSTTTAATAKPPPSSSLAICSRQVLLEAASVIYDGKPESAAEILSRLTKSNGKGNSEQRLMDYLFSALKSRVNPAENPPPVADLYGKEHSESTQLLFELSPCFKLGFMAANLAILEAALEEGNSNNNNKKTVFHVVDFDLGKGRQYMNLLYALSEKVNGKNPATAGAVLVKITAAALDSVEEEKERLNTVGETLRQVAERVGVTLQFKVVSCNLTDLTRESLGCEPDEPLAVNFAFKLYRMPDESVSTDNPRDELLRRVKAMEPRIVTTVEQEMHANTAPFLTRVNEACRYYSALFESIDLTVPGEPEREKVEQGLGRKLANTIACEGRDRVERCEVSGKWRARMGLAGFKREPLSEKVTESMKARLESGNRANPGFTVQEENGGACFGWMGKALTVASAWR